MRWSLCHEMIYGIYFGTLLTLVIENKSEVTLDMLMILILSYFPSTKKKQCKDHYKHANNILNPILILMSIRNHSETSIWFVKNHEIGFENQNFLSVVVMLL